MSETTIIAFITGGFTILGSILGLLFSIINSIITKNKDLKIERIKIFEGNRFNAYIELYQFIRLARSEIDPTEEFEHQLYDHLSTESFKYITKNIGYYSKIIRKYIFELDKQYDILTNPNVNNISKNIYSYNEYISVINKIYKEVEYSFDEWNK